MFLTNKCNNSPDLYALTLRIVSRADNLF